MISSLSPLEQPRVHDMDHLYAPPKQKKNLENKHCLYFHQLETPKTQRNHSPKTNGTGRKSFPGTFESIVSQSHHFSKGKLLVFGEANSL